MGAMTTEPGATSQAAMTGGGHVVLCGLGRIGRGILDVLRRLGERVTVITLPSLADPGDPAPEEDLRILKGDARDERLLAQAGLGRAKALIAATDSDLVNVTIALHARQTAPDVPVVVRLFDQDLAAHLRAALGIRQGYSASALAAPAFVAAALGDAVLSTFEAGEESWVLERLTVAADAPWLGRSLGELASLGRVVVAHERAGRFSSEPPAEEVVAVGDSVVTLARAARSGRRRPRALRGLVALARGLREWWTSTPRGLRFSLYVLMALVAVSVVFFHMALGLSPVDAYYFVITTLTTTGYGDISLQNARPLVKLYGTLVMVSGGALFAVLFSMVTDLLLRTRFGDVLARGVVRQRDHVIVAGLGHSGFRVLRELCRLGESTVAIESCETADLLGPARTLTSVVVGNAGTAETLRRAGLAGARTVLALTSDDLTNLSIALATKQACPNCRVVARVFDASLAAKMQRSLGIDAVISVTEASAPTFVGTALDAGVVRGLIVHDRLLLIMERTINGRDDLQRFKSLQETPLLLKRGVAAFQPVVSGVAAVAGDHVLTARWINLRN
jgi:Trk K+ transport system NAD-binding subunit